MDNKNISLLLADDDLDDCSLFKDALEEIDMHTSLIIVNNGVQLMDFLLSAPGNYPGIIFLDLNMPRKSGMECITEIKAIDKLRQIPIIVYSTSFDTTVVNRLYKMGVSHYIQKPATYAVLKQVIEKAITLYSQTRFKQPAKEQFVIQP